jgi:RNA polymerase sigma factor (sigma-70 family)
MIQGKAIVVGQQLEALWTSGTLTGMGDAQLLNRFAGVRDAAAEAAFRELVQRHGPMVMGVCRQILRQPHDADDAFQATFLVLVRKAGSIRVRESLAPWLYVVANRTARRARAVTLRNRVASVETAEEPIQSSVDDDCHFDLRPLLHEKLNRLPGKYRDPIVLCHLEGKTHEEAARLLRWPVGTVSGRLSRGRDLLRSRLKRRGMEISPAALSANWLVGTPTSVALPLIESTVGAAIGAAGPAVSTSVLSLTKGVLKGMLLNKLKMTTLVVVFAGGMIGVLGIWGDRASHATTDPAQATDKSPPAAFANAAAPFQGTNVSPKPMTNAFGPSPQKAGGKSRLEGAWRLVSSKDPRSGQIRALPADVEVTKLIVDGRYFWTVIQNGTATTGAGGRYEVDGETYTEFVGYAVGDNTKPLVGGTFKFTCKTEDGKWHHRGTVDVGAAKQEIDEVWERVP